MHITFIQTGGTIDKDYPRGETAHGYEFQIGEPAVSSVLPFSHAMCDYDIIEVTKKDSHDLTDEDRQKILKAVESIQDTHIVITHGTDTMGKTAETLSSVKGKTIILTGAMLPEKFMTSDARLNVGMAIGAVQVLPLGIYIALYGRVVPWQDFKQLSSEYEEKAKKNNDF